MNFKFSTLNYSTPKLLIPVDTVDTENILHSHFNIFKTCLLQV